MAGHEGRQDGKLEPMDARLARLRQETMGVVRAHQVALGRFPADPHEIDAPLTRKGWGQMAGFAVWLTMVISTIIGGTIYAFAYLLR